MNILQIIDLLKKACQAFVNMYYGTHGKVDFSIYDEWQKFTFGIDEGYWAIAGKVGRIVLQGTDEKLEWRGDKKSNFNFLNKLRIKKEKYFTMKTKNHHGKNIKIKVHPGFKHAYDSGQKKILNIVKKMIDKGCTIIVIECHSRGAGIATPAARDIKWHVDNAWKTKTTVMMIDGGAPGYYNKAGADEFDSCGIIRYRLVYRNDPVSRIPPFLMGYRHCGKKIVLGKPFFPLPFGWPLDHEPKKYVKGIEEYSNKIMGIFDNSV